MLSRFLIFVLVQSCGAAVGAALAGLWGALGGVASASALWIGADLMRARKVISWLREGAPAASPTVKGIWGEAADRTRRLLRRSAQQLDEQRARLQEFLSALQASPNGVVLLDAQGHIEWCNQTAASHLGFDAQRDLQQSIGNLVRDPLFAAYYAANDFERDVVLPGRDSTLARPLRLAVQLHPYGEGRKLLLSRDVTALEQADAMRRDFVANVSHEMRTPLTVLAGFIETLQTLPLANDERARYLELMAQQATRMQTVVSDLLTLSRLEGNPLPPARDWTPLAPLTAQCQDEARALSAQVVPAGTAHHHIDCDIAPQLSAAELAGTASELQSAMSNLVNNAVRYTPPGGTIALRWQPLGDGAVEFSVRDTGPGIAPEHLSRLTERFYRVDRSRSRETGGTGLGLAIVKHVAQRHGGVLRIDSAPGAGSTFAIALPAQRVRGVRPADDAVLV